MYFLAPENEKSKIDRARFLGVDIIPEGGGGGGWGGFGYFAVFAVFYVFAVFTVFLISIFIFSKCPPLRR